MNMKFSLGERFEEFIVDSIHSELDTEHYICQNVRLYSNTLKRSTQIDILVVTPIRIYCIEAKRFRTCLRGSVNDVMWTGNSGTYYTKIFNPVLQNTEHIRCLKREMRRLGCVTPKIENIVCVPNGCEVNTDVSNVITLGTLISVMENDLIRNPSKVQVNKIAEILKRINE